MYCCSCPAWTKLTDDTHLFPDSEQCDKYWTCRRGVSSRTVCPDGLAFHPDKGEGEDKCDMIHNIPDKCEGRPGRQRAKPGKPTTLDQQMAIIDSVSTDN